MGPSGTAGELLAKAAPLAVGTSPLALVGVSVVGAGAGTGAGAGASSAGGVVEVVLVVSSVAGWAMAVSLTGVVELDEASTGGDTLV